MTGKIGLSIILILFIFLASAFLPATPAKAAYTTWITQTNNLKSDLYGLWGSRGSDIYAAGSHALLHYNGSVWSTVLSENSTGLAAIWGISAQDIYGVGKSGVVLNFNGASWLKLSSGQDKDLYGVWGSGAQDVFAVGAGGTICHFDGIGWTAMNSGTTSDLYAVFGTGSNAVWAAGHSGTLLFYNGQTWNTQSSGLDSDLFCLWGSRRNDIFAAGADGSILHNDGNGWALMDVITNAAFYCLWGSSPGDVFAAGAAGLIAHYDGQTWSPMNRDSLYDIRALWGQDSSSVWAAGLSGSLLLYQPPAIRTISPDHGDQGAAVTVTLEGINLNHTAAVDFGSGIAVNSYRVLSAGQLSVSLTIVAGSAPGTRDVTVTTPSGSFVLPAAFQVKQALPSLTSVSPDQGRQGATLNLSIGGANLSGASTVQLGQGIAVNSFNVLGSGQISVNISIAADAASGPRDLTVIAASGKITLPTAFTVKQAAPVVASLSPQQGNQDTTLIVTIKGTDLNGATQVQFDRDIAVNNFTLISPTQIAASITLNPSAALGARDVTVTTPGGVSLLPGSFSVIQALPIISSITPNSASQGATLDVLVQGRNLTGAGEIYLGSGIAINSYRVINSSQVQLSVTLVAGAEIGARDISLTTPGGGVTASGLFSVKQGLPVISSVNPSSAEQGAQISVIINGTNLADATAISFGAGLVVQSYAVLSPTQIRVNLQVEKSAASGLHDVSLKTAGGDANLGNGFRINQKSLGTLVVALIWVGVALVVAIFALVLTLIRRRRSRV
jgi:hypothetical protein